MSLAVTEKTQGERPVGKNASVDVERVQLKEIHGIKHPLHPRVHFNVEVSRSQDDLVAIVRPLHDGSCLNPPAATKAYTPLHLAVFVSRCPSKSQSQGHVS